MNIPSSLLMCDAMARNRKNFFAFIVFVYCKVQGLNLLITASSNCVASRILQSPVLLNGYYAVNGP